VRGVQRCVRPVGARGRPFEVDAQQTCAIWFRVATSAMRPARRRARGLTAYQRGLVGEDPVTARAVPSVASSSTEALSASKPA